MENSQIGGDISQADAEGQIDSGSPDLLPQLGREASELESIAPAKEVAARKEEFKLRQAEKQRLKDEAAERKKQDDEDIGIKISRLQ